MSNIFDSATGFDESPAYQIRLRGQLGSEWAEWFGGLRITLDANGDTLLISPPIDQAALHGLLKKVRDLGLPLLSINPTEPDKAAATAADPNQSPIKGTKE